MISATVLRDAIDRLSILRFFPSQAAPVAELITEMCSTDEQVEYLAKRTVQLCNEWPGPLALREILCSVYKPADGVEAISSGMFPHGIPSENRKPQIAAPPQKLLKGEVSADVVLSQIIEDQVKIHKMPEARDSDREAVSKFYDEDGFPK